MMLWAAAALLEAIIEIVSGGFVGAKIFVTAPWQNEKIAAASLSSILQALASLSALGKTNTGSLQACVRAEPAKQPASQPASQLTTSM